MDTCLKVLMVGIGGYSQIYVNKLLDPASELPVRVVGAVDPFADKSPLYQQIVEKGIPVYKTLEEFYAADTADLAVIATPTHFHCVQSIYCMEHGSHVLCEKPVAATIDDVQRLIEAREKTGKKISIGYQWSHSESIQRLKADVLAGKYGKAKRMKTIVLWPRDYAYYRRGCGWAATKKNPDGLWVLDSVTGNATAHYLHNMLYVSGPQIDRSACVETLEVETYRANTIEMFDTAAMRVTTDNGVEALYLVTHAIQKEENRNPEFVFEFENGTVTAKQEDKEIIVRGHLNNGEEINYGCPNDDATRKLSWMVDVVLGKAEVVCGPEAASEHTKCVDKTEELIPETPYFPADKIVRTEERAYCIGLADVLKRCYDEWKLPSELGIPGFEGTKKAKVGKDYTHFAGV